MLARSAYTVARRKFLNHLDVRRETRACKNSFKKVVAENCVFRDLALQGYFKDINFINSLAAIGPLSE